MNKVIKDFFKFQKILIPKTLEKLFDLQKKIKFVVQKGNLVEEVDTELFSS